MPFFILAGVTAATGLAGAAISSSGAQSAANTQSAAAQQAEQRLQQNYQNTVASETPYQAAGLQGLNQLTNLLGPGGYLSTPANYQQYQQSPGYQFQLQQGEQALLDQQSALGGVAGGNTLKALTNYGQGAAATDYQQFVNNTMAQQNQLYGELGGLVNTGQGATTTVANAGQGTATQQANLITGAGSAQSAAQVAGANAFGSALTGGANSLSQNYLLSQLLNNGAGASGSNLAAGGYGGLYG